MTHAPKSQEITPEYVQAPRGGVVLRVPIENITHFSFSHKYAAAHTASGELCLATSLYEIEAILGDQVVRTHRSGLAVKRHLVGFVNDNFAGGGWAIARPLKEGEPEVKIRTSRREKEAVRRLITSMQEAQPDGRQ